MANPKEVEKKLAESLTALQRMSTEHLLSVEQSFSFQKRYLEAKKDVDNSVTKQLNFINNSFRDIFVSNNKIDTNRNKLYSDITEGLKVTASGMKSQKDFVKSSLISDKKSFRSIDKLIGNITSQNDLTRDKTDDFLRNTENPLETQIDLLKSINSKIGNLTGGKSSGFFDFLINGLPKIISALGNIALGGGELALGAGAGALFGKYAKWFSPIKTAKKALKAGKYTGKIIEYAEKLKDPLAMGAKIVSKIASPKKMVAAGVLTAGAMGTKALLSDDESPTPEFRAKGGLVKQNKPYIVGEKGQELFVPKESGNIIPNKVLNKTLNGMMSEQNTSISNGITKTVKSLTTPLDKNIKKFSKGIGEKNKTFTEEFNECVKYFKDTLSKFISKIPGFGGDKPPEPPKEPPKNDAGDSAKTGSKAPQEAPKTPENKPKIASQTNDVIPKDKTPKVEPKVEAPAPRAKKIEFDRFNPKAPVEPVKAKAKTPSIVPQSYHGEFKVPETGVRKLHDGEMVIPAYESEMVRAASELSNSYSIQKQVPANNDKPKLDEAFWMKTFVPAFAKAIKVDKKVVSDAIIRNASNPFG
jgi:hypothetical protein